MGFSFRSIFPPGSDSPGQESGGGLSSPAPSFIGQSPFQAVPGGQPAATPLGPVNAGPQNSPSPLFKAVQGESFQASPFSASMSAQATPALTVGDVLPQMPPEVARMSGLPPEHPVALPPEVLEKALSSGQPAVPLFEIWRVCPALFQAPVSPQDPRLIPLPASKLPRLIVSAQAARPQNGSHPGNGAAHPMGETPASAPLLMPQQSGGLFGGPGGGTALPPKRNGPPPPLADAASPFSVSLPPHQESSAAPQPGAQPFPVSPFSAVRAEPPSSLPPQAAPPAPVFSPASPAASPFQAQGGSPFAAMQAAPPIQPTPPPPASPVPGTLFAATAPPAAPTVTEATPQMPPVGAPPSPFTALFGSKAAPTGHPAPDAPPSVFAPPAPPSMPQASHASAPSFPQASGMVKPQAAGAMPTNGGSVRLGLAALLRGYSMAELGFDPMIVPAWIMTTQGAHEVREWAESPSPLIELGSLVDNITDVGFRNVLNNARRDFQVQLPREELQRALQGDSTPTLPSLASLKPNAPLMVTPSAPPASMQPAPPTFSAQVMPQPPAPSSFPVAQAPAKPVLSQPTMLTAPFGTAPASPPAQPAPPEPQAEKMPFAFSPPAAQDNAFHSAPAAPPEPLPFSPAQAPEPSAEFTQFAPALPFESPASHESPPQRFAEGFGSAELLGANGSPSPQESAFAKFQSPPAPPPTFPDIPMLPSRSSPMPEPPASRQEPEPAFAPPRAAALSASGQPALGIQANDTRPDQIMLRALLGTDEELTPQRIVEMTCALPGIAACVCLHGERAISHVGAHKPQAREFQKQATGLSHHLRSLAPLIGIEGAETFTLTSGDRLMTFCFPEKVILAILHDAAPSLGLRDKITLIARELSRMLS